jgi:hypothetical protein
VLPNVLDVAGSLTDLAFLYYRRRDVASLKVLYLVTFGEYAARAEHMEGGLDKSTLQLHRDGGWCRKDVSPGCFTDGATDARRP